MAKDEVWSTRDYAAYRAGLPYGHASSVRQERTPGQGVGAKQGLPESAFLAQVKALAQRLSWHCYHTHDSRRSDEGWPDLVLCNGTRLIIAELKSATGTVTPAQTLWLDMLRHTGLVEVFCWRPKDLPDIEAILQGEKG